MKIDVTFTGPVRRPWSETSRTIPLFDGETAAALLKRLGFTPAESRMLWIAVNGEMTTLEQTLNDGDRVTVGLRLGGG